MLIVMRHDASPAELQAVMDAVRARGFRPEPVPGAQRTAVCVLDNRGAVDPDLFASLPGVLECVPVSRPYKLVSRETHPADTRVDVCGAAFGGGTWTIIAGPCAVESRDQIFRAAEQVARRGLRLMRAGAFKPRTSPYAFQGLGGEGLALLAEVKREFGLGVVTEAIDHVNYDDVAAVADIVQIGARNMQNFSLLRRAGAGARPVLLKRGASATVDEWLLAAEYLLAGGNRRVLLCERGVRTFGDHTRNTLDLGAVAVVQRRSHLPVIVDPSHAAGVREFVLPLAFAGRAAGAQGALIEVHPDPDRAWSDGAQSLTFDQLDRLLEAAGS